MVRPAMFVFGLLAVVIGGCQLPTSTTADQKMEEFTSKEWKFKAKFPGKPEKKQQAVAQTKMQLTAFTAKANDGEYTVAVMDTPLQAFMDPVEVQRRLESGRDMAIKTTEATLESSKSLLLQGQHQGMEITAKVPPSKSSDGMLRGRIYLVGNRIYQTYAVGTGAFVNDARTTEFLDSFQATD